MLLDNKDIQCICSALHITPDEILSLRKNHAGLNNDSFILTTQNGIWIYRVPGWGTEFFCDRTIEAYAYRKLIPLGLCDEVIYIDEKNGTKLAVFYPDSHTVDAANRQECAIAMSLVRRLHQTRISFPKQDDHFSRIRRYQEVAQRQQAVFSTKYQELLERVMKLEPLYANQARCLTHGDLLPDNILLRRSQPPILLDWEFPAISDAFEDLGTFSHHADLSPDDTILLLQDYLEGTAEQADIRHVFVYCASAAIMWYNWAIFKTASGADPMVYDAFAQRSLDFAQTYLALLDS